MRSFRSITAPPLDRRAGYGAPVSRMIRKVMTGMAPAQRFAEVRGTRLHLDGAEGMARQF